jgi:hypothetical protein
MKNRERWQDALRLHEQAAADYGRAAASLPAEAWSTPIGEGKWTPAQITDHLSRAYEVVLRELRGGTGMAVRTRAWQRLLLRFTIVPRLLRGGWFPPGARAPRETRPLETAVDAEPEALLAEFRRLAAEFQAAAEAAHARDRRQRITHAYFGASSLEDGVLLCARHIEHHHRQLRAAESPDGDGS